MYVVLQYANNDNILFLPFFYFFFLNFCFILFFLFYVIIYFCLFLFFRFAHRLFLSYVDIYVNTCVLSLHENQFCYTRKRCAKLYICIDFLPFRSLYVYLARRQMFPSAHCKGIPNDKNTVMETSRQFL